MLHLGSHFPFEEMDDVAHFMHISTAPNGVNKYMLRDRVKRLKALQIALNLLPFFYRPVPETPNLGA